jgi:AdoMet-dependent heme synthase
VHIAFQKNLGGLVALLPNGRVCFLHSAAEELLTAINSGSTQFSAEIMEDYVLDSPYVDLDRFHLSAPAIAFIETTNLCNLKCTHCYAKSGNKRENELETTKILALIDELASIGVLQVFLTGGELFAHRDAVEIVKHARTKPFSTQIFSNGLLITESILSQIPPGQSFFISFDTAVPERTVRGKMDFPRLRNCFELMQKYGHVFRTAVSVHSHNIHDVEGIFDWCASNGYPRPQWLETHPIGRALINPHILLDKDRVDEVFDVYVRCMDRFQKQPLEDDSSAEAMKHESAPQIRGVDTIKFCQQLERATGQEKCGRSVAYIDSSGNVYPCSNCMSNEIYKAGNITEASFQDIWNTGLDEFRSKLFSDHPDCQTCPVQMGEVWCQFRCPPLAANVSGHELGCGATDYLRLFMLKANHYWNARRAGGYKLKLIA